MRFLVFIFFTFVGCSVFLGNCLGQDVEIDTSGLSKMSYAEIDSVVDYFYTKNTYNKGIPYLKYGMHKALSDYGEDSLYVEYLGNLGVFNHLSGYDSIAEPILKKSVQIKEDLFSQKHPSYLSSLANLASFYWKTTNYNLSEKLYLKVLRIEKNTLGINTPSYIRSLSGLGNLYGSIGQYEKAKDILLKVLDSRKNIFGINDASYTLALSNLAVIYHYIGKYEEAEELLLKAIHLNKKNSRDQDANSSLPFANLASLYSDMEKYEEIEALLFQAMQIIANTKGKDHQDYIIVLQNLAGVYIDRKEHNKAEKLYLEALFTLKRTNILRTIVLNNLAFLYMKQDKKTKAINILLGILKERQLHLGKQDPLYASALHNLAHFYMSLGEFKKAEELFLKTISLRKKLLGEFHPKYIESLDRISALYKLTKKYNLAQAYSMATIAANSTNFNDVFPYSFPLGENKEISYSPSKYVPIKNPSEFLNLSKLKFKFNLRAHESLIEAVRIRISEYNTIKPAKEKNLHEVYYISKATSQIYQTMRNNFYSNEAKLRILKKNKNFINTGLSVITTLLKIKKKTSSTQQKHNYYATAFELMERNKSILLLETFKTNFNQKLNNIPDSILMIEKALEKEKNTLSILKLGIASKLDSINYFSKITEVNTKTKHFLDFIEKEYPTHYNEKYNNTIATINSLQKNIPLNSILIEYRISNSTIYLLSISLTNIKLLTFNVTPSQLTKKTHLLRQALSDYEFIRNQPKTAREQYTKTAHWFYQNLVAPALDSQENINQLIIVPDHCLNHIPFEVFLSQASDTLAKDYKNLNYLLNDYSISYNYSATLLKENINNTPKQTNYKLLACAGYYTHQDSSLMTLRKPYLVNQRNQFKQLKSAEQEVAYLQAGFEGHFLTAEKANERSFKAIAPNYGVIHLAMHGRSDTLRPILSSLVFTENRDSIEDNFLQAYEISRLDLQAQLVVLSACETGYGIFEQGEGVLSLARSFMYAGVPSLVVSLWSVDDQSTALLMQFFYQHLAEGLPKDQALRQAKLDFMAQADARTMHPFFWASFIQLGHTKSIILDKKGASGTELLLLMAFITLIVSGVFYYQKKYFS